MLKRLAILVLTSFFLGILAFGCGGAKKEGETSAPPSQKGAAKDTLVVRLAGSLQSLDPHKTSMTYDATVISTIFGSLYRFKPGTNIPEPDLATSYEMSPDAKVYTFYLRKGVKWQKGYGEFTAEDVKFSFERNMNPANKTVWLSMTRNIEKIETPDPYTVKFYLKEPDSTFIYQVSNFRIGFIVSRKAVEELGDKYAMNPIGTGPFQVEKVEPKQEVVLTVNPDYYGEKPKFKKLVFKVIPDISTAEVALEKGDIDVLMSLTDPTAYERYKKDPNLQIAESMSTGVWVLYLDNSDPILKNLKVRQAIAHAINRKALLDKIWGGMGVLAVGPLPPTLPGYTEEVPKFEYDVEKAKKLMAEAGYPNGFEITAFIATGANMPEMMTMIQADLAKIGIKVNIEQTDFGSWLPRLTQYKMGLLPISSRPDGNMLLSQYFTSGSAFNVCKYSGIDELLKKVRAETDPQKQAQLYQQIQKKMVEDLPAVYLFHEKRVDVVRKNIKGYTAGLFWEVWTPPIIIE